MYVVLLHLRPTLANRHPGVDALDMLVTACRTRWGAQRFATARNKISRSSGIYYVKHISEIGLVNMHRHWGVNP